MHRANRPLFPLALLCLALCSATALAQPQTYLKVSAGTGFFVNRDGHVVTNAHVLRGCESISVQTRSGARAATLIASDTAHDLAVLKVSDTGGTAVAPLRENIAALMVGDPVTVIGFPGQAGVEGTATIKTSHVLSLEGPERNPLWIQLASVAAQGNSGGPVLDSTGNVVAVISGLAQTYRVRPDGALEAQPVGQSDVAITLAALQEFLRANAIPYYQSISGGAADEQAVAQQAAQFIVPIRCVQGRVVQ